MGGHGRWRLSLMPRTRETGRAITPQGEGPLAGWSGRALLGLGLALIVGLQLGALPWRYRREFWQLQGGLVGAGVGFVLGRLTAGGRSRRDPP
jgi:hypothetical protein